MEEMEFHPCKGRDLGCVATLLDPGSASGSKPAPDLSRGPEFVRDKEDSRFAYREKS